VRGGNWTNTASHKYPPPCTLLQKLWAKLQMCGKIIGKNKKIILKIIMEFRVFARLFRSKESVKNNS